MKDFFCNCDKNRSAKTHHKKITRVVRKRNIKKKNNPDPIRYLCVFIRRFKQEKKQNNKPQLEIRAF